MRSVMAQTKPNFYFSFTVIVSRTKNEYLESCVCSLKEKKKSQHENWLGGLKNTAFTFGLIVIWGPSLFLV